MKVSALVKELKQLDQNLEVYCMTSEDALMASGDNNVRTFLIDSA